jgi:hypothetical protein
MLSNHLLLYNSKSPVHLLSMLSNHLLLYNSKSPFVYSRCCLIPSCCAMLRARLFTLHALLLPPIEQCQQPVRSLLMFSDPLLLYDSKIPSAHSRCSQSPSCCAMPRARSLRLSVFIMIPSLVSSGTLLHDNNPPTFDHSSERRLRYNAEGAPNTPALYTADSSVNIERVFMMCTPHRICKTMQGMAVGSRISPADQRGD